MTKYTGKLTISRTNTNQGSDFVSITLSEEGSHTRVLALDMDFASFAQALLGMGYQPCTFKANVENLGKVREFKVVKVLWSRDLEAAFACAPFETDGWKACLEDYDRPSKKDGAGYVSVDFTRYVDKVV